MAGFWKEVCKSLLWFVIGFVVGAATFILIVACYKADVLPGCNVSVVEPTAEPVVMAAHRSGLQDIQRKLKQMSIFLKVD